MAVVVLKSISILIMILEVLLLLYIFLDMFHVKVLKKIFNFLLEPILLPIQALLRHSVFHTMISDISPIIAILILSWVGELL